MIIKLVRHGESEANVEGYVESSIADHLLPLTPRGFEQAREAGQILGSAFLKDCLIYTSPFRRAKETLHGILEGAEVCPEDGCVREDPRLREVEHGYFDVAAQRCMIETHGHFYYRYQGGESAADCYDRVSGFLESFMRSLKKTQSKKALIVTHGLALRVFVMRFLHLTVEQFDTIANPYNADIVTIAPIETLQKPQFRSERWGV
ncbi:MAG TPA: histidine phosphatase family protein, partial [Allocoleopsis sp.]